MTEEEEKVHFMIGLMRGVRSDGGEPPYMYVAIMVDHIAEFRQAVKSGEDLDVEKYGFIIESGVGEPSEEVKRYMTEKYSFDHENQIFMD